MSFKNVSIITTIVPTYIFVYFRDSTYYSENMMCSNHPTSSQWNQEAILASYSIFRGFLNAMDAEDSICSQFFICEGSHEAAKLGWIGTSLAKVARYILSKFNKVKYFF